MNPANIMKLMSAKNKFSKAHPGVSAFMGKVFSQGVEEGSIIEISITRPDGTKMETNMRVRQSDLELLEELKALR